MHGGGSLMIGVGNQETLRAGSKMKRTGSVPFSEVKQPLKPGPAELGADDKTSVNTATWWTQHAVTLMYLIYTFIILAPF